MKDDVPWLPLKEVCHQYGMTIGAAYNAIKAGRFPVPTFKVGKFYAIDKEVHAEFFRQKREAGLAALRSNEMANQHPKDEG